MPPRKRRQRGSILLLPSGSHRVTVYAGRDVLNGKARQLRETAKTYEDAKKVLTCLQRAHRASAASCSTRRPTSIARSPSGSGAARSR
jgi:hypothetical protein